MGKIRPEITHHSFDTEDNSRGRAFLYDFYDIRTEVHSTFVDQLDALDYVCSHRYRVYWAVNLEYDLNNLFRSHAAMLKYVYAGSRLIVAELPGDHIRFLDTLNHWPFSVAKMGKRIGLPKLEMKHTGKTPAKRKMIEAIRILDR